MEAGLGSEGRRGGGQGAISTLDLSCRLINEHDGEWAVP